MKTVYRFVKMQQQTPQVWAVLNKKRGNVIGYVHWYEDWKQWVLGPDADTVWSAGCLADIEHFIGQLGALR